MHRILHIIETGGPGGAETTLANLVGALRANLWTSRVIVPRPGWLHDRLSQGGADVRVLESNRPADTGLLLRLVDEIHTFAPHLIHTHLLTAGVYGTLAAILAKGPPVICTLHGTPDVRPNDPFLWVKSRLLGRRTNRVVYVSHALRHKLRRLLGVPSELEQVIHNGVAFSDPTPIRDSANRVRLAAGEKLVGAVGNVRDAKDYPNLLRAARLVCDRRRDVRFAVVGEASGPLWDQVNRLRKELCLEERVHFLGFRPRVQSLIQAFDLFVSSSSSEGLPLAPIEAMGLGKPVVLTRCGGVPEIVTDEGEGVLVEPGDPKALADGILGLLSDPLKAAALGSRGRESVRKRFALTRMISEYESLYLQLISSTGLHDA